MNKKNVESELELYLPMKNWLQGYLEDNYKGYKIITVDAHSERLDRVLAKYDIVNELAVGLDLQIDVLGIAKRGNTVKLFFIEAKKTNLTLRDLGQLWSYCKLIEPEEAFLYPNYSYIHNRALLNILKREDLLDYGSGKFIKKMKISTWNLASETPDLSTMIPKI